MSKYKLSEIGFFKNGLNFRAHKVDSGCKIIGIPDFGDRYVANTDNLKEINSEIVNSDYYLKENDILLVRSNGNKNLVGRSMIIGKINEPVAFSGFCIRFRITNNQVLPLYVLYLLKSPLFRKLFSNTQQTSISNLNQDALGNIEFDIPSLNEQHKIVEILHSITLKIETNETINDNLQQQLKLLYDYWFIQFDFPDENGKPYKSSGGKMLWNAELKQFIPQNWEVGNLYQIADFINGLACQNHRPQAHENSLPVIKIKEMHNGISNDTEEVSSTIPSKYIVKNGDILFSWSASLEVMFWYGGIGGLNQHIFKVIPRKENSNNYVYYQLSRYVDIFKKIAESRKTTMGHITTDHLQQSKIIIAHQNIIDMFESRTKSIRAQIQNISGENLVLRHLQQFLLPLLMNGQATISD